MNRPSEARRTRIAFDMGPAWLRVTSLFCIAVLIPGDLSVVTAQQPSQSPQAPAPVSPDYLDSLVAPIALYPDPLLAQVLAASTYPLEIVQLQQWLEKHKDLKGKALADAVERENWDPSVQGLADLPDVVRQLADNVKWTSELGNAFLAQQSDVMTAVQRMREKAQGSGKLKSSDQMSVETRVVDNKSVVVIEQANPQIVYVPSYDPAVIWGAPAVYPYPPVYYPPAGYYAAGMALSFGVGVAMGAFWGGGGWGYNCGWGGNNSININNNNNFIRNSNNRISGGNQIRGGNQIGSGNRPEQWQHNPQHRGGAPYGDRATANRFGGTTRGDTTARREANARQNLGQRGGTGGNRPAAGGGASGFTGDRGGPGGASGLGNRGNGPVGPGNRGGGDRIGNRQIPSGGGGGGAFSGARGGGAGARASGSRGASSFGGSRGGGGFRGGGGRRR